jgi:hypothetical protein
MRDQVLWRKTARIINQLAECLNISPERAMDIFYNSHTYSLLANPASAYQLLSDEYIVNDALHELEQSM